MVTPHRIKYISPEDIELSKSILSSKTKKDRETIIYLYKKYIDTSTVICKSCNSELIMLLNKYKHYFEIYIQENTQEDGKETI
jgi:hypothetical protein